MRPRRRASRCPRGAAEPAALLELLITRTRRSCPHRAERRQHDDNRAERERRRLTLFIGRPRRKRDGTRRHGSAVGPWDPQQSGRQVCGGDRPHHEQPPKPATPPARCGHAPSAPRNAPARSAASTRESPAGRDARLRPPGAIRMNQGASASPTPSETRAHACRSGSNQRASRSRKRASEGSRPPSVKNRAARPATQGNASTPTPRTRGGIGARRAASFDATGCDERPGAPFPMSQASTAARAATSNPRIADAETSSGTGASPKQWASAAATRIVPPAEAVSRHAAPRERSTSPKIGSHEIIPHDVSSRLEINART